MLVLTSALVIYAAQRHVPGGPDIAEILSDLTGCDLGACEAQMREAYWAGWVDYDNLSVDLLNGGYPTPAGVAFLERHPIARS